jgi:ribosome biogenesis GTPase A
MAKAVRRIREYLRAMDVVVEVVDARIPRSGRNALLGDLGTPHARVVALDRQDLADPAVTKRWLTHFAGSGASAVAVDARAPRSVARIAAAIEQSSKQRAGRGVARAMIVGVPNSGKSTIVNSLLRRASAKTANRAGVTRQTQWFRLSPGVEVMDTPGVLPPKMTNAAAQWKLALCGAVPRERYDPQEVADAFHRWVLAREIGSGVPDLQTFAAQRGFVRRGGQIDYHNAAHSYISAFNGGAFGRLSLEAPDDPEAA